MATVSVAVPEQEGTSRAAKEMLEYLKSRGIDRVFGVVGREASSVLFDEVEGLDFVLTRHEFTAGVMADVRARLTGEPQVAFATLGPGVTNLSTAVASACLDRSPVIFLGAQAETNDQYVNHTHQCLDNVALMAPMAKFAAEVRRPEDLIPVLDQAFTSALEGIPGPSFVSLPIDILGSLVEPRTMDSIPRPTRTTRSATVWEERLDSAAELLRNASNPMLVVGTAVARDGAEQEVVALAEKHSIPVVSSYTAKGILPHDHPLNYGAVSGYMDGILGHEALDELFGPVDLLVLVGYDYVEDLRPTMWARGVDKQVVRLSGMPNPTPGVLDPDLDVICDIGPGVSGIRERLGGEPVFEPHSIDPLRQRVDELLADETEYPDGLRVNQVVERINHVLGDEGVLVSDIGFFRHFGVLFSRVNRPYGFVTSAGCSTFGFGLPAAMGAQLARPDAPVVMIAGDGGFHSNSQDLETLVRLDLPVVMIVLNNNSNGLIRLYQNLGHGRDHSPAVDFGDVDFVALAAANGCDGLRVSSLADLKGALTEAIAARRPFLIEAQIAYDMSAAGGYQALEV